MSGFDLQEKLIQAKAVMDKVDGRPSNMNNTTYVVESNGMVRTLIYHQYLIILIVKVLIMLLVLIVDYKDPQLLKKR